jgi:hypothetical protein
MGHNGVGRADLAKELITMRIRTAGWWPPSGHTRSGGPSPRRGLRAAVLGVVVIAAGVSAGSASAVGQQPVSLQLVYSCAFPSGSQPVSAQITATFPATETAGKSIQPTGTGVTVTLSHAVAADLAKSKAATITLAATLSTGFTEGSSSVTAVWQDLKSASEAIPRTGPLKLTTTGTASPVKVATAGQVSVAAGDLSLLFTTRTANNRQVSPSTVPVACTPRARQHTALATITVSGPASANVPALSTDGPATCTPFPKNLEPNPLFPYPTPLPGSNKFNDPENACAYATGFANEQKLHGAALVGPGLTDVLLGQTTYTKFQGVHAYVQVRASGKLNYQGRPELPPARATLLGFGFMPVSATLQISEIGTVNADFVTCAFPTTICPRPKNFAQFFARVSLSVSDVDVNGVPLNVGPHCQTATPFNLELTGVPPSYNVGAQFGVLTGTVTVPPFTGCGVGENLDSIFTASVSGPGNYTKVTQGEFCVVNNKVVCPPPKPFPKR